MEGQRTHARLNLDPAEFLRAFLSLVRGDFHQSNRASTEAPPVVNIVSLVLCKPKIKKNGYDPTHL